MQNFILYSLFSWLDYLALTVLMHSIFRTQLRYYKLQILSLSLVLSILSYFIVLSPLLSFLPLIVYIVYVLSCRYLFYEGWVRSLWIAFVGYLAYIVIQSIIITLSSVNGLIDVNNLNGIIFTKESYVFYTLCSLVAITVGLYMRYTNTGFMFEFYRNKMHFVKYLITLTTSVILIITLYFLYSLFWSLGFMYYTVFITAAITLILLLLMSKYRDDTETSVTVDSIRHKVNLKGGEDNHENF